MNTRQDKIALRGNWFQERVTGKFLKEACALVNNTVNLVQRIIQTFQCFDGGDVPREIDFKWALGTTEIGDNPLGKKSVANTQSCKPCPLTKGPHNNQIAILRY